MIFKILANENKQYENNIRKINECEIGVHYFQELNDNNKPASEFREIINLR